jgi:CsoR family transcriptional regulator, copper-sensing transcriptional repressor
MPRTSTSYHASKADLLARLNRIEGQVRGIKQMVEDDRYCADVLQQIAAVKSGADAIALLLLADHMRGCVATAIKEGDTEEPTNEVVDLVRRLLKS